MVQIDLGSVPPKEDSCHHHHKHTHTHSLSYRDGRSHSPIKHSYHTSPNPRSQSPDTHSHRAPPAQPIAQHTHQHDHTNHPGLPHHHNCEPVAKIVYKVEAPRVYRLHDDIYRLDDTEIVTVTHPHSQSLNIQSHRAPRSLPPHPIFHDTTNIFRRDLVSLL
jgi:hypothetical protein